jgi:hypothetical protein
MKIIEQSDDRMVLLNYDLFRFFFGIGAILIGIIMWIIIMFGHWYNIITIFLDCFLLIAGVYHFFSFRRTEIVLDKIQTTATVDRKSLVGHKIEKYNIPQISKVCLHIGWLSGAPPTETHQLVLIMQDGNEVQFEQSKGMSRTSYQYVPSDHDRKLGQEISVFLGVPFQDEGDKNKAPWQK